MTNLGCDIKDCLNAGLIKLWSFQICTMHNVGSDAFFKADRQALLSRIEAAIEDEPENDERFWRNPNEISAFNEANQAWRTAIQKERERNV